MKLGRHEVLMVPYKCCCFSARSVQGRIQGGAKVGHGGGGGGVNVYIKDLNDLRILMNFL